MNTDELKTDMGNVIEAVSPVEETTDEVAKNPVALNKWQKKIRRKLQ